MADIATIYEWAGGRDAFARWLNRFYDLVEAEAPEIAAMFGGQVSEEHRVHVLLAQPSVVVLPIVHDRAFCLRANI